MSELCTWRFSHRDKDRKPEYFFPKLRIICGRLHNSVGIMSGSSSYTCGIETFDPQGRTVISIHGSTHFSGYSNECETAIEILS